MTALTRNQPTSLQPGKARPTNYLSLIRPASDLVQLERDRFAFTNSRIVAVEFSKRHADVLRSIENLDCSPEFRNANLRHEIYVDERGQNQPSYRLTEDGWIFLVMGYRGIKAAAVKERFIAAFREIAAYIREVERTKLLAAPARESLRAHRRDFTDAVKLLATLAKQQAHPMMARFLFVELTRFVYKALDLFVGQKVPDDFRDRLTAKDLRDCGFVEAAMAAAIMAALESGQDDCDAKAVRTAAKEAAMQTARLLNPVVESMTASGLRKVAA